MTDINIWIIAFGGVFCTFMTWLEYLTESWQRSYDNMTQETRDYWQKRLENEATNGR